MIQRSLAATLLDRLSRTPAVALLGSRQVGKTTLARSLELNKPTHYLDLERPSNLAKLADPWGSTARPHAVISTSSKACISSAASRPGRTTQANVW